MKHKTAVMVVLSLLVGVFVSAAAPLTASAAPPSFRAAASANSSTRTPTIRVPASVQVGDQLVYVLTTNSATTATTPAGWTLLGTQSDGNPDMRSWVFTRTAVAGTAGSTVSVSLGGSAKASRMLVAYSGAGAPVSAPSSVMGARSVNLTSPSANIAAPETLVLSYWSDKSGSNSGWTVPAGVTGRGSSVGSGSGRITAAIGETVRNAGNWPGATATSTVAGTKGIAWTIALPAVSTNANPTASFTSSCTQLDCAFDGRASADSDGTITQYAWNFGDGATAAGATVNHSYASSGSYNVTLTVTDDRGATASSTVAVSATVPPGAHTTLPPSTPRTDTARIENGEIHDLEYIGNKIYVSGSFTSIRNATGNTTSVPQRFLAAFDLDSGLVDMNFRPTFDGSVEEIEASPDGTRLYVVGRFNNVNGIARRKIVALNPTNGSVITSFTANANSVATSVEATDTTVYVGGQFSTVRGVARSGLVALNASDGSVVTNFNNNLSGGIGVNGMMTVQAMVLTPDLSKLLVVHTARQIAGQDRYGVGLISTQTNQLLPWSTDLWKDNLQFVGGIQRIYTGAISPNGEYFVVASGSGGDRPPINDTAVAFSIEGGAGMQPLWITRLFDSIYSLAISDVAVYVGGHFVFAPSPTAPAPWPGLTNVGYGFGQGLSGYGLGDDVVRRDQIAALNPLDGTALEWNPGSNAFEGHKAMLVHPRGVITGADARIQGGVNIGRVAVYDFESLPATGANETTITLPIEGRVEEAEVPFTIEGVATAASGVNRVNLEIQDRDRNQYLQDDLVTWGGFNTIDAQLAAPGATESAWSQTVTIAGNRRIVLRARTVGMNNSQDASKAVKTIETFGLADQTPNTGISAPSSGVLATTTFTMSGTATDDVGVNAINYSIRDGANRYLQDDGSTAATYNTFRVVPDVIGATNTTWSTEVVLPYESEWTVEAIAVDTAGQSDLRGATRSWIVSSTAVAPTVAITAPAIVNPPTATAPISLPTGAPVTFSGIANDDQGLRNVEITLRNSVTGERLAADGSWGPDVVAGAYRISPVDIAGTSYNWSYTTPFNLTPGSYVFQVRATDDLGLTTANSNRGNLTINVQIVGDAPPNGLLDVTGTQPNQSALGFNLTGTATDDFGVAEVRVTVRERVSGRYLQPNGALSAAYATLSATLAAPGATATAWSLAVTVPSEGEYDVVALAFDTVGQQDVSTSGATARYPVFPGDMPPAFVDGLFSPPDGQVFTLGTIVVSGRVEDDRQIARVEIAIRDSLGRFMNGFGAFSSTSFSWRSAFLNSPGSPGSNFSYTSPVIPAGNYTVFARGVDANGFVTAVPMERNVTVTVPDTNLPPVASFTASCVENVCTFDARTSTDESPTTLTYSWNFGQGSGSGAVATRRYTSAGDFTVTLTARDEFGLTGTATQVVTIVRPAGNLAPVPVINEPSCVLLVCNFSAVGTADPNVGDTISYVWSFGDGGATATGTNRARTFPAPGTYVVSLTATDGWGDAATVTREVTVSDV